MNRCLFLLFCVLFLVSYQGYSQLSDIHYLPPLKQQSNNVAVREQTIYLSTPETTSFTVRAYRGTNTTPLASFVIDNLNPATYNLGNGDNGITMVTNANTGIVLTDGGLRFETVGTGGQKFYVNYRGVSGSQAASLTSKGKQALGKKFKWGGVPLFGSYLTDQASSVGIMATENNTVVDIYGYDSNCKFRLGNARGGITSNTIQVVLNAGESYVLEANREETAANIDGWLGATIEADKDIVISNGGLNVGAVTNYGGRDAGMDQPVGETKLGKEYILIRGGGVNSTEFGLVIATQNNTAVYVNGATTATTTLNTGEYFIVPGSNYSSGNPGANMYIRTSKDAYMYQSMAGSTGQQTNGINFVAPTNCLLPDHVDNIPNIRDAAGTTLTGGITVIASTSTPDANIVVTDGNGIITKPASLSVTGNADWKTFYIPGLTGDVDVQSTGPIAVGFFGANNNRGIAGYFSGFDLEPNVDLQITGTQCLPGSDLVVVGEVFDSYQWFFDGNPIPGATNATYNPAVAGDYYVQVSKGPCTYDSNNLQAYYCNPDIELIKSANTTVVDEGAMVTFTVTAQNFGVDPATNVQVIDVLPSGLSLISASPTVGTWSNPTWNIGTLTSGTLASITIIAQATINNSIKPTQFVTNTVTNTQDQTDSNITPDNPSVSLVIVNDFDADGVMDIEDLDDDNDGILDTVECGLNLGSGTAIDPFRSLYAAHLVTASGRYYFNLGAGLFQADVDTSNGGGWVLVLQYVHGAGTNPNLSVIGAGADLPVLSKANLGVDESLISANWGHLGNAGFTNLKAKELRWYAETTGHNRIIHFSSSLGLSYAETGTGNFVGVATSNTKLSGHTANIPDAVTSVYGNQGDYALTNFPFWRGATYHWGIKGNGSRWEVDDYPGNFSRATIHRVWARNTVSPCTQSDNDAIPDNYDLDSDGDGCSDANEAYGNAIADGGDGGQYGTGFPPPTNTDGTVTAAAYTAPLDVDTNSIFEFQETGVAPTISVQPTDEKTLIGDNGKFDLTSVDADSYQWEVSTDGGTTFSAVVNGAEYSGVNTFELTIITPTLAMNGFVYRAVLMKDSFVCGETFTNQVILSCTPKSVITNRRITIRVDQ